MVTQCKICNKPAIIIIYKQYYCADCGLQIQKYGLHNVQNRVRVYGNKYIQQRKVSK